MLLLVDGHLMSLLVLSRSSQIQRLSDALGMRHIPPTNMFPLVNGQPNRHLTSDGQPVRLQSLPKKKRSRRLINCYWSRIALPYGHWWHRFTHLPPSRHRTHDGAPLISLTSGRRSTHRPDRPTKIEQVRWWRPEGLASSSAGTDDRS
jgi:hypothetical protein